MPHQATESKRLLSHTIAEWACSLNYETSFAGSHSSGEIILVRFDRLRSERTQALPRHGACCAGPCSLPATGTFLRNFGRQQNQIP